MRLRFALPAAVLIASSILTIFSSACSSGEPHPDAGNTNLSSASSSGSSSGFITDGSADAADAADSGQCSNGAKDGSETDIDCGGTCAPCVDGKLCLKKEDCNTGLECEIAELGKPEKKCRAGTCIDAVTNGGETDLNCGGTTGCNRCTVGKRCTGDTDCRSAKCNNLACACPVGMTIVTLSAGGAYCVDTAEVTKGQYNKFIEANVPKTSQDAMCLTNTDWIPTSAWPPATSPPAGGGGLAYNFGLPVHFVDWCDAAGYCKWAKKELCGKIGGGPIAQASANDATQDAWYNACSAQGTKAFSYENTFTAGKCIDGSGSGTQTEPGLVENNDLGMHRVANVDGAGNVGGYVNTGCQGGYVGLYQMTGNVAEWENSCDDETTPTANCKVRGGSYTAGSSADTQLRCDADREAGRLTTAADVGFRCCLY